MTVDRLRKLVNEDFDAVNQLIIGNIQSQIGLIEDLSHHIIESGGKRLRPLLVLLTSHACNYQGKDHIILAAMIEFFHTATLLHDDVVDESTLRRGRETANEIWGSKASILVGDYLFTHSVQLMVSVSNWDIIRLLSDTSHQISCSEVKQLVNRHNAALSIEDYLEVIRGKTALLFATAAALGGHLSHADKTVKEGLYEYGLHLGNAFQLVDDILDYSANTETIGKNIGDDLADGKATMPLIYAFQKSNLAQQNMIEKSLREGDLTKMDEILATIKTTKAIEYTQDFATNEINQALNALQVLPESPYKQALKDLAHFAIERKH